MNKTPQRIIAVFGMIFTCAYATTQPLHQPIPNYTSDGTMNRTGHGSTVSTIGIGGFMEETMGGIAVNGNYHYLAQNAYTSAAGDQGIILDKKNASNGTSAALVSINIGLYQNQAASLDRSRGIMLDPSLNRAYIYGKTNSDAFILCYDLTTLALVSGFGTNGLAIIENGADATGMVSTGTGNNFTVAINKGTDILLREYTSSLAVVQSGTISLGGYTAASAFNAFKKSPNGHFFIAGYVNNTTSISTQIPMIWDCVRNSGNYALSNSSSPTASGVGNGAYADFDFYINPVPANPGTYLFDLVTVGNTASNSAPTGIYARYIVSTTPGVITPDPTFKNQAALPGVATPGAGIKFTRCTMGTNGYTTVLGFYLSSFNERAQLGYLTPSGNQYTSTYLEPSPTPISRRVHKAAGLAKDGSGNILIAGCTLGYSYTITKLSDAYDCMPVFNVKGSSSVICLGDPAGLNANISTPNCIMTWKKTSPTQQLLYSGLPVSLEIYPTETSTYECTVTNPATGCQASVSLVIQVLNDPSFTLNMNTMNNSYFTLSALANDQSAGSYPGFGYAWFVEELDLTTNNPIFTFSNPSCWWIPLSTPNVFNGINCITNTYSGNSTIANCSVPTVGRFRYGHRYRITRGTWNDACNWQQKSITVEPYLIPPGLAPHNDIVEDAPNAPDFSHLTVMSLLTDEPSLLLFPNPGNGQFTVSTEAEFTGDFYIYDITGKLVQRVTRTGSGSQLIDAGKLTPGVYYLEASVNGVLQTEKFVVE